MLLLNRHACCVQVVVLSEGYNLFYGTPERVLPWFSGTLGYPYKQEHDGAVSDWLMDLVSVGFQKPASFQNRCAPARRVCLGSRCNACAV